MVLLFSRFIAILSLYSLWIWDTGFVAPANGTHSGAAIPQRQHTLMVRSYSSCPPTRAGNGKNYGNRVSRWYGRWITTCFLQYSIPNPRFQSWATVQICFSCTNYEAFVKICLIYQIEKYRFYVICGLGILYNCGYNENTWKRLGEGCSMKFLEN